MIVGFSALGVNLPIHGVSVKYDAAAMAPIVQSLVHQTAELFSPDTLSSPLSLAISDSFIGEAYGLPTPAGLEALRMLAQVEWILIDPVYTSKAMAWLIDAIKSGTFTSDQRILFLHTGGSSSLFGYSDLVLPDQ
ncbi:Pyridoxal-phosphate dependent enzyme [Shimia gijangensis]|uniref:Pyridoxal-phosphate dependent enzyme n=1 Tax=Shimia gijangensis TaxID=1470563 RepID=A0A1M6AXH1_9RHOB|nr:pyridoxal-phosphate dependent enzyme [Shimia gijangensis]SHI41147.1 Pyridoxal-phosphate dependent enzyme [Shimia gijangensis]